MNQPTYKQIREFWEWCGFTNIRGERELCLYPEDKGTGRYNYLPTIDLNSLFKWAVPVAIKAIMIESECDKELAYAILFKRWLQIGYDALALFWALWKVKEVRA